MRNQHRFAIVITHEGVRKGLLDMNWLEKDHRVDESDLIVLSREGWRDVARGEASVWEALQRKLLIGLYVSQPELIAVIGHPLGASDRQCAQQDAERHDVARIVRRVRSLLLPTVVMGFWTDEDGWLIDIVEPHPAAPVAGGAREESEPAA